MLTDLAQSIAENFKERISNPLLGAFTAFAIAANWKPLVVLFTSELKGRFLAGEITMVSPSIYDGIFLPAILALCFAFIYPNLKIFISMVNSAFRISEIKIEYRIIKAKRDLFEEKDPIESLIQHLSSGDYYEKIGYHSLKRLKDALPKEEDLLIKSESDFYFERNKQ